MPQETGCPDPIRTIPTASPQISASSPGGDDVAGRYRAPLTPFTPTPPFTSPASSTSPDFRQLLQALRRRWLLASVLGLLIGAAVAVAVWFILAPKFVAFMQLRIASQRPRIVGNNPDGRHEFNTYLKSQAALIRSREVLDKAITGDDVRRLSLLHEEVDPVAWLEENLNVEHQDDNELVSVSLAWDDPEEAKTLVQAIINAYETVIVREEDKARFERVRKLQELYDTRRNELASKKKRLEGIRKDLQTLDNEDVKLKLASLMADLSTTRNRLSEMSIDALRARGELLLHEAQEKGLAELKPDAAAIEARAAADPDVRKLQSELDNAKDARASYAKFNKKHPGYRRAQKEIERIEGELKARKAEMEKELTDTLRKQARSDYDAQLIRLKNVVALLEAQEKKLGDRVTNLHAEAAKVGSSSTEKEMIEQDVDRSAELLANLGGRLELSRLDLHSGPRVLTGGRPALQQRSHKKQILATALGFGASLFATCFGVAWWDYRRKRIRYADQVGNDLKIPVVGAIPASTDTETFAREDVEVRDELLVESVHALRTFLLRCAQENDLKVIMIASAETGEGKTTLAALLASSLARAGRKTLLIDGDLRDPALHELYDLSAEPGLSDVLIGESDSLDAIQSTAVDGLMLMTAGQCDREVLGSLARNGMEDLFQKLTDEFDFIILDSHPILHATDALVMGQCTDAVVLTLLQDVSHAPRASAAVHRLTTLGITIIGAVINGLNPSEAYGSGACYSTAAA